MTSWDLNYRYGAFVEFMTGEEFDIEAPFKITIFEKGEITAEE